MINKRNCMLCNIPVRKKRFWERKMKEEHYHLMPIASGAIWSPFCVGCAVCVTKMGVQCSLDSIRESVDSITSESYYDNLTSVGDIKAHQRMIRVYKTWSEEGLL